MAVAKETVYRWPLDDFDDRFEKVTLKDCWASGDFKVKGVPKAIFCLWFCPKGDREEHKDSCSLYLHVENFGDHSFIRLKYEFWLENGVKKHMKKPCEEQKFDGKNSSYGWSKLLTQTELLELAKGGSLVAVCKVTPLDPVDAIEWVERTGPLDICRNLAGTFDSDEFADAEVRVPEKSFKVAKAIICAGSPVFRRMFLHETKERETGVVEIKKEDPEMIELLLRYFYSGKVEGLKDVAARLLPVADCYEMLDLANLCLESLIANVSVETILRDLKLAFAHDHKGDFKQEFLKFAHDNFQQVKLQPGWTPEFVEGNSQIVMDVMALLTS